MSRSPARALAAASGTSAALMRERKLLNMIERIAARRQIASCNPQDHCTRNPADDHLNNGLDPAGDRCGPGIWTAPPPIGHEPELTGDGTGERASPSDPRRHDRAPLRRRHHLIVAHHGPAHACPGVVPVHRRRLRGGRDEGDRRVERMGGCSSSDTPPHAPASFPPRRRSPTPQAATAASTASRGTAVTSTPTDT